MGKRVILTLLKGNLQKGFPALLRIRDDRDSTEREIQVQGELPPENSMNPTLWQLYDSWQTGYQSLTEMKPSRLEDDEDGRENSNANIHPSQWKNKIVNRLNDWLNSGGEDWQRIRDELNRHLTDTDEVRVIIQTKDMKLRLLPWHVWKFFADASIPV